MTHIYIDPYLPDCGEWVAVIWKEPDWAHRWYKAELLELVIEREEFHDDVSYDS